MTAARGAARPVWRLPGGAEAVHVRLLEEQDEFRQCERIQKRVWGHLGVAAEVLMVTQKYGGVVLGAFSGSKLVGFLYAFLARRRGRLIHWSHMMAVEAAHRGRGIGLGMKTEHRRIALERGIRSIAWTYDPLQSANAALNVARLGGCAEEYVPDYYGRFGSRIERGLASDRLVVNWAIGSARVERRLRRGLLSFSALALPRANETRFNRARLLENVRLNLRERAPRLLVEIPTDTDRMRAEAIGLARRWRLEVRKVFTSYFAAGYIGEEFLPPGESTEGRCFYVLRRRN